MVTIMSALSNARDSRDSTTGGAAFAGLDLAVNLRDRRMKNDMMFSVP
jgi:hypothetical protein